jgi:hypothetical protein
LCSDFFAFAGNALKGRINTFHNQTMWNRVDDESHFDIKWIFETGRRVFVNGIWSIGRGIGACP